MQIRLEERFWKKVDKKSDDECWNWTAFKNYQGYGTISVMNKNTQLAHRVSWELHNGPIQDKLCVLHKCDNSSCVNPKHLFLGTRDDNTKDRNSKNRQAKGENHSSVKLTEKEVLEIRKLYSKGDTSCYKLAKKFKVGPVQIHYIVTRKNWKHI